MHNSGQQIRRDIAEALASQKLAVLATERDGQPYTNLMAFAYTDDLASIVVATGRATRKHMNLQAESRVSLLIDTRSNSEADFHKAVAVTVIGDVRNVDSDERPELEHLYLSRHPYLNDFIQSPTTALLKVVVHHYVMVSRFQQVMELHLSDEMDLFAAKQS